MTVPADKSVTHRALILGALAKGETIIKNPLLSLDTLSTANCLKTMGADIRTGSEWRVFGKKLKGGNLDCGNSGTTLRLLMGVAATISGTTTFTGDKSLRSRPIERIAKPLCMMGAKIEGLKVVGGELNGIDYSLPIPSAQVKSSLILSGLFANGKTVLRGRTDSRDHTESMIKKMGGDISFSNGVITVKKSELEPVEFEVLGDPSSAAFAVTLALLCLDGYVYIRGVEGSFTRLGFFNKLIEAGADIRIEKSSNEGVDIIAKSSKMSPFCISENEVPYLIDELPLLSLIACYTEGESVFRGVGELKHKESNRINEIYKLIKSLGGEIEVTEDTLTVFGKGSLEGGGAYEGSDHRMVMTATIAYALSKREGIIQNPQSVQISYPEFFELFD